MSLSHTQFLSLSLSPSLPPSVSLSLPPSLPPSLSLCSYYTIFVSSYYMCVLICVSSYYQNGMQRFQDTINRTNYSICVSSY